MTGYDFRARIAIVGWYDPDTAYAVLDQGNQVFRGGGMDVEQLHSANARGDGWTVTLQPIRHRCALIQAPEKYLDPRTRRQPNPAAAASYAEALRLAPPGVYECTTYKAPEEFGRPLFDLHLPDGSLFSERMLTGGFAERYRD